MIATASATLELPAIGTSMFLVLGEGVNFRSRLESVDGDTFTVAAPLETAAGPAELAPGRQFDVFWVPPRTRVVLPTRLVAISDEAPFRWILAPTEAPRQSNRREFVRGGGGVPVRIADGIEGALLDISEGGLRCWIDEPTALQPGDEVHASVWLGAYGEIEVAGTVLTVREAPHGDPGQHIVLTFAAGDDLAQIIRGYVMNWEINERLLSQL